jgi:hypothetical protein
MEYPQSGTDPIHVQVHQALLNPSSDLPVRARLVQLENAVLAIPVPVGVNQRGLANWKKY